MNSTTRQQAIHPHDMQEIERIFDDILRDRGLTRRCEAAERIAKRLVAIYQSGVRDCSALKALARTSRFQA
ncbi:MULTISPECIES: hypothetical protein [Ensifer]|uniref:hypothetical protein n=1 Tax=Ensifer TaxID=106591 RepID=UPI000807458B|nr:hypothetical protein [Ensifer adhaerens]